MINRRNFFERLCLVGIVVASGMVAADNTPPPPKVKIQHRPHTICKSCGRDVYKTNETELGNEKSIQSITYCSQCHQHTY